MVSTNVTGWVAHASATAPGPCRATLQLQVDWDAVQVLGLVGDTSTDTGTNAPAARTGDIWAVVPKGAAGRMCTVPKPYPREFREDVVRVAGNGEPGQHLSQIAADFGISESCLTRIRR